MLYSQEFCFVFYYGYFTLHIILNVIFALKTAEKDMERVFKLPSTTFIGGQDKALPLK